METANSTAITLFPQRPRYAATPTQTLCLQRLASLLFRTGQGGPDDGLIAPVLRLHRSATAYFASQLEQALQLGKSSAILPSESPFPDKLTADRWINRVLITGLSINGNRNHYFTSTLSFHDL